MYSLKLAIKVIYFHTKERRKQQHVTAGELNAREHRCLSPDKPVEEVSLMTDVLSHFLGRKKWVEVREI